MTTVELTEGMPAPPFTGQTNDGPVSLADHRGETVVLYFYPKDNTSGWIKEACGFRDANDDLQALGAVVLGVSKDSLVSHAGFSAKHGLNFPLIADPEREILEAYGVWRGKKLYGKTSMGVVRSTFVIDGEGVIRKIWRKVKVAGHTEAVLQFVRELR